MTKHEKRTLIDKALTILNHSASMTAQVAGMVLIASVLEQILTELKKITEETEND